MLDYRAPFCAFSEEQTDKINHRFLEIKVAKSIGSFDQYKSTKTQILFIQWM